MRSASRSPSTRATAADSPPVWSTTWSSRRPRSALVLAERTRDGGLDARGQDRGELAGRAAQLVDVALRAREQRPQIGACGLARRGAPLSQLADAAQRRLARIAQWIVLRVLGIHRAPLVAARSVDDRLTGTRVRAMNTWHSVHGPDGQLLFDRLRFARTSASRMRGLLGRRSLPAGEGLAFREKSVHMFFMRMSLDIVFCDAEMQIVRIATSSVRGAWPAAGRRATRSRSGRARPRDSGCARAWCCRSSRRSNAAPADLNVSPLAKA